MAREVSFVSLLVEFEYGIVVVFKDLYGNLWDLIEFNENNKGLMIKW